MANIVLDDNRVIEIQDKAVIGSADDSTIVIKGDWISPHHARLTKRDSTWYIEDLGSDYGTWVNGLQITTLTPLIGETAISFSMAKTILFRPEMIFLETQPQRPAALDAIIQKKEPVKTGIAEASLIYLDPQTHNVYVDGKQINPPLSPVQYRLVEILFKNRGKLVNRDAIIGAVWLDDEAIGVSDQAVDALVRRVRDRIAELSENPDKQLMTVRGHGFMIP